MSEYGDFCDLGACILHHRKIWVGNRAFARVRALLCPTASSRKLTAPLSEGLKRKRRGEKKKERKKEKRNPKTKENNEKLPCGMRSCYRTDDLQYTNEKKVMIGLEMEKISCIIQT